MMKHTETRKWAIEWWAVHLCEGGANGVTNHEVREKRQRGYVVSSRLTMYFDICSASIVNQRAEAPAWFSEALHSASTSSVSQAVVKAEHQPIRSKNWTWLLMKPFSSKANPPFYKKTFWFSLHVKIHSVQMKPLLLVLATPPPPKKKKNHQHHFFCFWQYSSAQPPLSMIRKAFFFY